MTIRIITAFTLSILMNLANAQSQAFPDTAEFHSEITRLYSFEPHKLSKEQIKTKSAELDLLWNKVRSKPDRYLSLLRNELKDESNSAYFSYDGSKLLLLISEEKEDKILALESIPRADLQSIQNTDYLRTVHWFARNGFDTTKAALRILDYPDFKTFIVQHVLTLGQNYCLIYMLFPMPDSNFVSALIDRLKVEKNAKSQKSILLALWYSMSLDSKVELQKFSVDSTKAQEVRDYARQLLEREAPLTSTISVSSVDKLKKDRQEIMHRISDEALHEFDNISLKILAKQ